MKPHVAIVRKINLEPCKNPRENIEAPIHAWHKNMQSTCKFGHFGPFCAWSIFYKLQWPSPHLHVCVGLVTITSAASAPSAQLLQVASCFVVTVAKKHSARIIFHWIMMVWERVTFSRHLGRSTPKLLAISRALTTASKCGARSHGLL